MTSVVKNTESRLLRRLSGALRQTLSNEEEGCRSAWFGTTISRHGGHHLLFGGIAKEGVAEPPGEVSITYFVAGVNS